MTIKVEKREFLSKDAGDLSSVCYGVEVDDSWPNMSIKINDGSDTLYLVVSGSDRKSLNESLGVVVKLRTALDEFIGLVTEHQTEILKAYAARS